MNMNTRMTTSMRIRTSMTMRTDTSIRTIMKTRKYVHERAGKEPPGICSTSARW